MLTELQNQTRTLFERTTSAREGMVVEYAQRRF
jgi:hypothetical protein